MSRLAIFSQAQAREKTQMGPVKNGVMRTQKNPGGVCRGLNLRKESLKHGKGERLDFVPWLFPIGLLSQLLTKVGMKRRLLLAQCGFVIDQTTASREHCENISSSSDVAAESLVYNGSRLLECASMSEMGEIGTEELDCLSVVESGCRLLIKLQAVKPTGKKDKSRVSSSVVNLSNMTSVLGEESSDASVNSILRGSRQI